MKIRLVLAVLMFAAGLFGGPITSDLWDSSRAGFSGPIATFGSGSSCGSFVNIFGGSGNTGCGQTFSDTFDALGFDGPTLNWQTASVTIGSFALYSPSNFGGGDLNEIVGFRLYTLDSNNLNPVLFYNSGVISHNPANDGTTPLLFVTLATPVTSANWRMEVIGQNSAGNGAPIYRIIELDGFAPAAAEAVPEPATYVLTGGALAGLALWRRRRRVRQAP